MCTCVTMNRGGHYFGRTLDLEYDFDQRVIIAPRALPLTFRRQPPLPRHYAMIGMASAAEGFPLFAEAVNEKDCIKCRLCERTCPDFAIHIED